MNSPPPTMSPPMPDFQPRREFVAQSDMAERVPSEIALLALSGVSLLRLCSFSPIVINDLRYFLSHTDAYSVPTDEGGDPASSHNTLLRNFREDTTNHLVEFALDGRPWTISKQRPGALHAEHLFVQILTIILRRGYTFVTQVDYGREHDDRVSIVFSRSLAITRASTDSFDQIIAGGSGGGSSTGLQGDLTLGNSSGSGSQDEVLVAFALSFASATELRVIKPPLDSTPAILHAVRSSWPRGVVSEKKISHDCYQFKLKGYHWFQQDTFSLDSLRHIQTLLTSLDAHGFTLLTSLSLSGNHSRVKDLWIFTGMGTDTDLSLSLTHTRARSQNNAVNANINGSPDAHIPTPESSESSDLNLAGIGAQTRSPGVHYANEDPPRSSSSVLRKKAGHRKSLSNPSNPFSPLHSGSLNGAKPSPRTATTTLPLPSTPSPRQGPTSPTRIPVPIHEVLYTTPVRSPSPYGTQPYAHQYPYPQPDTSMGMGMGGGAPASGYPNNNSTDNNQQVHFWTPQRDDRHDGIGTRDAAGGIGAGISVSAGAGMGIALAAVDADSKEASVPVDPKTSPNAGWATQRHVPRDVPQSVSVFPDGVEEDVDASTDVAGGLGIVPNTIPSQPISQHTPSPTPSTPHLLSPGVFRDSAFSSNTDDASGTGTRLSGDSMGYLFGGPGARGTMGTVGSMTIPIAWTGAIDAVRSQSQSQSPAQRQVQAPIGGERVSEDVQVYAPNTEQWGKTEEELHGQVRAAKATLLDDRGGADTDTRLHGSGLGPSLGSLALALAPELNHNTNTSTGPMKRYDDAYDDNNRNNKSATTQTHASDIPTNGNVTTEADIRNNDTTADARLRDHNVNVLLDPHQTETGNPNATQNENPNPKINDIANDNVLSEFMGTKGIIAQGSGTGIMRAPDGDLDLTQHVQSSSVLTRSPNLKNEEKKDEEKGSGVNVQMKYNPDTDRDHPTDPFSTPNQPQASAIGSTPILPLPLPIHDSTHHSHDQGTPAAGNTPTRPRPPPSFNRFETSSTLEFSFPGAWQPTPTLEKSAAQASFPTTGAAVTGGVPTLADDPHTLTLPAPADHANQSLTALPHEGTQAQGNAGPVSAGPGSHQSHHADYPTHNDRNANANDGKNRYDGSGTGSGEWNSRGLNSNPPLRSSPPSVLHPLTPVSASGASANVNETDPGKSRLSGDSDLRLPGYLPLDEGEGIAGGNANANVSVAQGPTGVIADPQYPTLLLTSIPLHKVVDAERAVSPDALSRPPLSGGSDHKSEVAIIEHLRGGSKEAGLGESGEDGSGEPKKKKKEGWVMIDVDSSVSKGGLIKSTDYAVHSTVIASTSTPHPVQSQTQSQDQASGDTGNPPMTPPVEQASSMSAVAKVIAATDAIAPADPDSADVLERSRGIVDAYTSASPAPATPSRNKGSGSVRFVSGEEKQGHSRSGSGSGSATSSSPSSSSTIRRLFSRSSKSKASSKSKLKP